MNGKQYNAVGDKTFAKKKKKQTVKTFVRLTFVEACSKDSLICWTGTNVPYFPRLVENNILIDDIVFIIKVYDVDLKEKKEKFN